MNIVFFIHNRKFCPIYMCRNFIYDFPLRFSSIVAVGNVVYDFIVYGGVIGANPYERCAKIVQKGYKFSTVTESTLQLSSKIEMVR